MTIKSLYKASSPEMPVLEHLGELRRRLMVSVAAVILGAFFTYTFSTQIFEVLTKPYFDYFPADSLIGTGPAEAFILKLKVAIVTSFFLVSPVLFHQVWLFISPGLYDHERRLVFPFVASTTVLFLLGSWLCYAFIVPVTFAFFREQYASIPVTPQIRISEHLSLMLRAIIGFGVIFETPVLAYFLGRFGVLDHHMLIRWSRYAAVVIFVLAAILTPTPDVLTQTLFALPLFVLYGISILIVKWTHGASASRKELGSEEKK